MFEIVGQTGGFGGIILASHTHCDICLNARLVFVDAHEELQTVWKSVHLGLQGVAGHGLVIVLRSRSHYGQ